MFGGCASRHTRAHPPPPPALWSQAHWVKERAAKRCVVVVGGDPPFSGSSGTGRMSFRGQNPAVESEALAAARMAGAAAAKPQAVNDAGAGMSDEEMAARCVC